MKKVSSGQFGNLYYHDSDGKVVFINDGKIKPEGKVSLELYRPVFLSGFDDFVLFPEFVQILYILKIGIHNSTSIK
ncbi:hypothetical protein GN277_09070 [Lachnospiraceae bacterium WCA-9-b2]|uniref:Uncharacterized protein n=1 Tax=Sporofaciens musculi TaxID=2681861 RepID=A0A7X3MFL9_9FIRM|nr:hypothetical protein [Sporofaciens musculi]MXP75529.1 hypothetical protein [Sporofaciens musculi]